MQDSYSGRKDTARHGLVKSDLLSLDVGVDLPIVIPISCVALLLDGPAESSQRFGHVLPGIAEDTLQLPREVLLRIGEEGDRATLSACSPCPSDAVNVVFDQ